MHLSLASLLPPVDDTWAAVSSGCLCGLHAVMDCKLALWARRNPFFPKLPWFLVYFITVTKETQTGSLGQKADNLFSHLHSKLVEEVIGNVPIRVAQPISELELPSYCPRAVPVKRLSKRRWGSEREVQAWTWPSTKDPWVNASSSRRGNLTFSICAAVSDFKV